MWPKIWDWGTINLIALLSLSIVIIALQQSRQGNKHSQTANKIASNTLGKSSKANELSANANQIAGDALEISRSKYLVETTNEIVDWTADINHEGVITITNIGTHMARNVVAIITGVPAKGCERAEWRLNQTWNSKKDVVTGTNFIIDLPQIREVISQARHIFILGPPVDGKLPVYDGQAHMELTFTIHWKNSAGVSLSKIIHKHFD